MLKLATLDLTLAFSTNIRNPEFRRGAQTWDEFEIGVDVPNFGALELRRK